MNEIDVHAEFREKGTDVPESRKSRVRRSVRLTARQESKANIERFVARSLARWRPSLYDLNVSRRNEWIKFHRGD